MTATDRLNRAFLWANATSVAATIGAAVAVSHGVSGSGWLIFVAVITHTSTLKVEAKAS